MRKNPKNELYTAYCAEVERALSILIPEARLAVLRVMKTAIDEVDGPAVFCAGTIIVFSRDRGQEVIDVNKAMNAAKRAEKKASQHF